MDNFKIIKIPFSLRGICIIVGVLHLILVLSRIYERTWELIVLEEPFLIRDHKVIIASYIFQVIIATLLIYGSITDTPNLTVPWLLTTTPIFVISTIYGLFTLHKEYLSQNLYNIISIGCTWAMWYCVLKYNLRPNTIIGKWFKYRLYAVV